MMRGMVIDMNDKQLLTLAQLQAFLDGTAAVDFSRKKGARLEWHLLKVPSLACGGGMGRGQDRSPPSLS